ncbi:hypothetical protein [Dokdonella sp.]|uniref:hypothetical protein n=1 Tax=Dokdonella sp. TaxID=2291710 RepID=UPI002613CA70|nr:hypothetical protein [Dokdonella sp.]
MRAHMPLSDFLSRRSARNGLLALLSLLVLAPSVYGAATMDYARDIFIALRLLDGQEFPLTGPLLNGASVHLGPIWYYLLAALLAVDGRSWLATTLIIGLLASLQVPLAYLAGKALRDRRTGLSWAALLVVPGWGMFNTLLPSHPMLAPMLMLAFIVCAARYAHRAHLRYLFGMAASFTLAVHAHPSALALAWIGLAVCLRAWRRDECNARYLAAAALVAVLPLLPSIWSDATQGFADLGNANTYLARTHFLGNLAQAGTMVAATLAGGLRYWLETMLAWPPVVRALILLWAAAIAIAGTVGFASLLRRPSTRRTALAALAAAAAGIATIATMRDITPFYMAVPVYLMASGVLALGLSADGSGRATLAPARVATVVGAVVLAVAADAGSARFQQRGSWSFGWWPLIDVKHAPSPHAPMLWMPSYAMRSSGRFLCSQQAPSLHGVYATHLLLNYAIEMRLACGRSDALAGGSEEGRQHWLGLSRAMLDRIGVEPQRRLGPLGVIPATPLAPGKAIEQHATPVYPPYWAPPPRMEEHRTQVALAPDDYLVVSNVTLAFPQDYTLEVRRDGHVVPPLATDAVSRVYACDDCSAAGATLEVTLRSVNLQSFDFVTFHAPAVPRR